MVLIPYISSKRQCGICVWFRSSMFQMFCGERFVNWLGLITVLVSPPQDRVPSLTGERFRRCFFLFVGSRKSFKLLVVELLLIYLFCLFLFLFFFPFWFLCVCTFLSPPKSTAFCCSFVFGSVFISISLRFVRIFALNLSRAVRLKFESCQNADFLN